MTHWRAQYGWLLMTIVLAGMFFGGCCVVEGTNVATPQGNKLIESLRLGDEVLSISSDGKTRCSKVVAIHRHVVLGYREIELAGGRRLRVTDWHPVATRAGWMTAAKLNVGQEVQVGNGWGAITAIRSHLKLTRVYDISVAPHRNFIANGVLVHNKSAAPPPKPSELPGVWIGPSGKYADFCRMELYSDGTGLFASGPYDLYRITEWTTGDLAKREGTYKFYATLKCLSFQQKPVKLKGEMSSSGLYYRLDFWLPEYNGFLSREERVTKELVKLRNKMESYRRSHPTDDRSKDVKTEKKD